MIVLLTPLFDHELCLMSVDEDPAIETVIAKSTVETFDKGVLPRTAQRDVHRPLAINAIAIVFQHRRDDPLTIHRLLMGILAISATVSASSGRTWRT